MTQEEIYQKVRGLLVDALSADEEQVTPHARLQADLNAESIDMLDIVFRIEREFGLGKLDRNELFPESIFSGDATFVQNGKVTASGLKMLREKLPFADSAALDRFDKDPKIDKIGDLFTVDLLTRFIDRKLNAKAAA